MPIFEGWICVEKTMCEDVEADNEEDAAEIFKERCVAAGFTVEEIKDATITIELDKYR